MSYKAVIFDLDGTLLNTLEDIAYSANTVLKMRHHPTHSVSQFKYFVGEGVFRLFEQTLPETHRDKETISTCAEQFREVYKNNPTPKIRLYDGIAGLLDALSERKVPMAILSNKPHELTKISVADFFPEWHFDIIFGQREGIPPKPDPMGAVEIAVTLNIPPSDILYLGDTSVDMKTAVSANMFPVGALWGFRDQKELVESGAKITIAHPLDLVKLLDDTAD